MFSAARTGPDTIVFTGRLDAAGADMARAVLVDLVGTCHLEASGLQYIASVGLGLLAATQRRLQDEGGELILCGLNPHLRELLSLAGFDGVFRIE